MIRYDVQRKPDGSSWGIIDHIERGYCTLPGHDLTFPDRAQADAWLTWCAINGLRILVLSDDDEKERLKVESEFPDYYVWRGIRPDGSVGAWFATLRDCTPGKRLDRTVGGHVHPCRTADDLRIELRRQYNDSVEW